MRIVRTPDGQVVSDPSGRRPGRGAYLCADGSCWGRALEKGSLSRALGVALPDGLREELAQRAKTMTMTNEGGDQRGEE
ncbi:MAG: YlxR family protein [Chloroflexota bacterium]